jgi:glutamate N-acetyltransferase/amino-acid N-acetyltransferase
VVVNSGNANCATGKQGLRDAEQVCASTAKELGTKASEVFPSSTGVIGVPLPVDKIVAALPAATRTLGGAAEDAQRFARAIMTTDTRPKLASACLSYGGRTVTLLGIAKGAGMIHPNIATMLAYIFTDVEAKPSELREFLTRTCADTFNAISIDGDTSTNDTVLLLASGASGVPLKKVRALFARALDQVCASLAEQIVRDGEGVQHVIRLHVEKARTRENALQVARSIATSMLVKTAWAGADPNWGRILAAAGRSGIAIDPGRVDISFGPHQVCRRGMAHRFDEDAAHRYLSQPAFDITVRLNQGRATATVLTSDLSAEYVRINADYRT